MIIRKKKYKEPCIEFYTHTHTHGSIFERGKGTKSGYVTLFGRRRGGAWRLAHLYFLPFYAFSDSMTERDPRTDSQTAGQRFGTGGFPFFFLLCHPQWENYYYYYTHTHISQRGRKGRWWRWIVFSAVSDLDRSTCPKQIFVFFYFFQRGEKK